MSYLSSFFGRAPKEPPAVELTRMDELGFREQELNQLRQYIELLRAHPAVVFGLFHAQKEARITTTESRMKRVQAKRCALAAQEAARKPLGETDYLQPIRTGG